MREETHRFRTRKPAFLCGITHSTARSVGRPNMTVYTAVLTVHTAAPALRRPGGVIGEVRHRLSLACDCTFTAFPWPVTAFSPPFLGPVTALPTPFLGLGLHFHRLSLPIHRLSLACDCTSTAFPRLSTAFPPPFPVTFHCLFQYFQVITYSTCHCLFLTFRCLSSTFHQPSSTFHCLSSAFHCLSSTFHCLSSNFHYPFALPVSHCPFALVMNMLPFPDLPLPFLALLLPFLVLPLPFPDLPLPFPDHQPPSVTGALLNRPSGDVFS